MRAVPGVFARGVRPGGARDRPTRASAYLAGASAARYLVDHATPAMWRSADAAMFSAEWLSGERRPRRLILATSSGELLAADRKGAPPKLCSSPIDTAIFDAPVVRAP